MPAASLPARCCATASISRCAISIGRLPKPFVAAGAAFAESPRQMAETCEMVITCLPSPAASAAVMEGADGILSGIGPGKIWLEMSTTDAAEIRRLATLVEATGAEAVDCPVSGGVHRAATGNISILAGCKRQVFERVLPVLKILGRRILHTGEIGSASTLKVMTNYLATANLLTLCEALATMKAAGMDLATTYEAIRISSGNSFVHETESQMILNGSRDISFSMDLVLKDIGLFQKIADKAAVPLEISPLMIEIFRDGQRRYGDARQLRRHHAPPGGGDGAVDPGAGLSCGDGRRRAGRAGLRGHAAGQGLSRQRRVSSGRPAPARRGSP